MRVTAVVPAHNCESSIGNVLRQLYKAKVERCVVVANGCSDETVEQTREVALSLQSDVMLCVFPDALGHDVPRSVGAIYALRHDPLWDGLIFIDGDWLGAFGNNLADYLQMVEQQHLDGAWPMAKQHFGDMEYPRSSRIDLCIWREALAKHAPDLLNASPSQAPLWASRQVFTLVSPLMLARPGRWIASCIGVRKLGQTNHLLRFGCIDSDSRWFGNPTGSKQHQLLLRETLVGDAVEGACLLDNQPLSRAFQGREWAGYDVHRNLKVLRDFAASIRL
ncbi:glycosyltransferase [Alicyclobacillus curvatus]|nr:glycosyltransferase [Alicyclobacillus curvatus]